jgi:hypothetical protein
MAILGIVNNAPARRGEMEVKLHPSHPSPRPHLALRSAAVDLHGSGGQLVLAVNRCPKGQAQDRTHRMMMKNLGWCSSATTTLRPGGNGGSNEVRSCHR